MKRVVVWSAVAVVLAAVVAWLLWSRGGKETRRAVEAPRLSGGPRVHPRVPVWGQTSISGTVIGAPSATVVLMELRAGVLPSQAASADGVSRYHFEVAPGRYCLVAAAGALSGSICDLELLPGEQRHVDITLTAADLTVTGTVKDAGGGPVPQATLIALGYPDAARTRFAVADDQGNFQLRVSSGAYTFVVSGAGYTRTARLIQVVADTRLNFLLNPAAEIHGRVVDGRGPVAGAEVVALAPGGAPFSAISADDGTFEMVGLSPGLYDVLARKDTHVGSSEAVKLALGDHVEVTITLAARASLRGIVRDERTGAGVAGATVWAERDDERRSAVTARDGSFALDGPFPGAYRVWAVADGYAVSFDQKLTVAQEDVTIELRLRPGGEIRGRVTRANGQPVADASIWTSASRPGTDPRLSPRSGPDGSFVLVGLPAGELELGANHPTLGATATTKVHMDAGGHLQVDLRFDQTGTIRGVVRREGTHEPVPRVRVVVRDTAEATFVTDAQGRFEATGLPAGSYFVEAVPPTALAAQEVFHPSSQKRVDLGGGAVEQVDLEVPSGALALKGTVKDDRGAVGGAAVWAERQSAEGSISGTAAMDVRVYTLPDGSFEIPDLPSGRYVVYADDVRHGRGSAGPVSAPAAVTVTLPASARISGRVLGPDSKPVTAFVVHWKLVDRDFGDGSLSYADGSRAVLDPNGRFVLEDLDATPEIEVSALANGVAVVSKPFALAAGQQVSDLELRLPLVGNAKGRVIDVDKRPQPSRIVAARCQGVDRETAAEADGRFSLTGLPTGTCRIDVSDRPFARSFSTPGRKVEIAEGGTVDLGDIISVAKPAL